MKEGVLLNKESGERMRNILRGPNTASEYLFLGQGGQVTRNGVFKCLRKYADKVGLAVSPHTLRHT
jgi:site-specific recombinase XerD